MSSPPVYTNRTGRPPGRSVRALGVVLPGIARLGLPVPGCAESCALQRHGPRGGGRVLPRPTLRRRTTLRLRLYTSWVRVPPQGTVYLLFFMYKTIRKISEQLQELH